MTLKGAAALLVLGFWAGVVTQHNYIHPVGVWLVHGMALALVVFDFWIERRRKRAPRR